MTEKPSSRIAIAAARLRALALERDDGGLIGREEALVESLGASRSTVRQAARLLEREGLLRVRRGIRGGYFAGRPTLMTVEASVSSYLGTLDMDAHDVTAVASVLWIETLRKAASLRTEAAREVAARLRAQIAAIAPDAPFAEVLKLERESREAIFALTRARYIELIFQINEAFARTRFPPVSPPRGEGADRAFLEAWRKTKLMECDAIHDGDPEFAMTAARRSRTLWHERVWPSAAEAQATGETPPSPGTATAAPDGKRGKAAS